MDDYSHEYKILAEQEFWFDREYESEEKYAIDKHSCSWFVAGAHFAYDKDDINAEDLDSFITDLVSEQLLRQSESLGIDFNSYAVQKIVHISKNSIKEGINWGLQMKDMVGKHGY